MPVVRGLLNSIVEFLKDVNITVKEVVCDQGTSKVTLAYQLGVTTEKAFLEAGGERICILSLTYLTRQNHPKQCPGSQVADRSQCS